MNQKLAKFEKCLCRDCEEKEVCKRDETDIIFRVMDGENDVTLTDGAGVVLRVSDSYEKHFAVSVDDVVGKSVYELESQGIFKPSVTKFVLRKRKKVTLLQKNKRGDAVLTTGVPIFDDIGDIEYVISFNAIDIADMTSLHEKYKRLNAIMKGYDTQLKRIKMRELQENSAVTKSQEMKEINELILQVADIDANVLITGETGVGKSMAANMLHMVGKRSKGPFIEINCGAIPPTLIESELFGYEKGAFTGADDAGKIGKIELANDGVLFLDEIGELPLDLQIKLLQVIQEKTISRIGGLKKIDIDFRLVAATNKDLKEAVAEGTFREDLYYRLNVIEINMPSLRERRDDIVPLIAMFTERFNERYGKHLEISREALSAMEMYDWPGNIRQLENFVERLTVTHGAKEVKAEDLPREFQRQQQASNEYTGGSLASIIEQCERDVFLKAYEKYRTSVAVGKALGISQTTAARKLRKYIPNYAHTQT